MVTWNDDNNNHVSLYIAINVLIQGVLTGVDKGEYTANQQVNVVEVTEFGKFPVLLNSFVKKNIH